MLIFFSVLIGYYIYSLYNNSIYYKEAMNIKGSLERDYKTYKKCINTTNQIVCGRSSSNIKKKIKLFSSSEDVLFHKPSETLSNNLKECDKRNADYLVAITTGTDYFSERYVYREFYLKFPNVQFFFFTGISKNKTINQIIKNEIKIHKDIVLFPFISTYHTSSLLFVSEMKWVIKRCNKYKWLIHHQADVFINIIKSIEMLINTKCEECCVGQLKIREKIYRSKSDLYYIPEYLYPNATEWPPYLSGPIIYFTNKSLQILNNLVGKVHPQFWAEDVYIGLLFQKTNISYVDIKLAYYPVPRISIQYALSLYAVHDLTASELYFLMKESFSKLII